MRQLDLKELAARVSVEHGIRVDHDDPIMAVVTLNRLVLELATNEVVEEIRIATREFEQAVESVQVRAGSFLAERAREFVSVLRQEAARNVGNSSIQAQERIGTVAKAIAQRWAVIGMLAGMALFGCGVWVGTILR